VIFSPLLRLRRLAGHVVEESVTPPKIGFKCDDVAIVINLVIIGTTAQINHTEGIERHSVLVIKRLGRSTILLKIVSLRNNLLILCLNKKVEIQLLAIATPIFPTPPIP